MSWLLNGFINCSFNEMFKKLTTVLEKRLKLFRPIIRFDLLSLKRCEKSVCNWLYLWSDK